MLDIFLRAAEFPLQFTLCLFLAAIPAVAWFLFFARPLLHKGGHLTLTFIAGMGAGGVVLLYQYFWGQHLNLVFFSVEPQNFKSEIQGSIQNVALASFFVFLSVGFIEELLKHWLVKKTDHSIFESVDDVIEFSIVGALGFAFLENIGYFFHLLISENPEHLFSLFFIRSVFVVFIHVLCSGIYGYFYGLGFFATPLLKRREKKGIHTFIPDIFHKIFHLRKDIVFHHEMTTLGLLIAMFLHGIYDFLLSMNFVIPLGNITLSAHFIFLPLILLIGFSVLNRLLAKKEDQERFGHLEKREVFVS